MPSWNLEMSMDQIASSLDTTAQQKQQAQAFNNNPPQIIYSTVPSMLVSIDGDPVLQPIENSSLQRVANTPFLIVYNPNEQRYYLNGNGVWYTSSDIKTGWNVSGRLPREVAMLADDLEQKGDIPLRDTVSASILPQIIVSTNPAELIQSKGEANLVPIEGTNILYVSNSDDNILLDVNTQQYYALLSGRWYAAPKLQGPWAFVPPDQLPGEFATIPVGSPKDNVLASIAGTPQATDAVHDAMLPQTATVDRSSTTTSVQYDGDPEWDKIDNTDDLYYSPNASESVLRQGNRYYAVDNGVWFASDAASGPWAVATVRPSQVAYIPPSYPVYNVRYVYIYDYTPNVVYVGYTPGYTGSYIYGPTIVYGTGFYYHPWHRKVYIPRPVTWGLNMAYNPWTGWSIGYSWNYGIPSGWFGWAWDPAVAWGPRWGGWWGPHAYRPPVFIPYNHYYGPRPVINHNVNIIINNYYTRQARTRQTNTQVSPVRLLNTTGGNIYANRQGVAVVRPANQLPGRNSQKPVTPANPNARPGNTGVVSPAPATNKPGTRPNESAVNPGVQPTTPPKNVKVSPSRQPNNVYSDRQGNVYKYEGNKVQQYDRGKWNAPANNNNSNPRPVTPPVQKPSTQVQPQPRPSTQPAPSTRPAPVQTQPARPAPFEQRNRAANNADNFQHFQQDVSRMNKPQQQARPQEEPKKKK